MKTYVQCPYCLGYNTKYLSLMSPFLKEIYILLLNISFASRVNLFLL